MSQPLLRVEGLHTYFHTVDGVIKAVRGVSFDVPESGVLGVVGESGSGKTVTGLSIYTPLSFSISAIVTSTLMLVV